MAKKQKRPARFKFKPFSKQQQRLMHWWRPGLIHPIGKDNCMYYWFSYMVSGDVFRAIVHPCRKDNGSFKKECCPSYATDT